MTGPYWTDMLYQHFNISSWKTSTNQCLYSLACHTLVLSAPPAGPNFE